MRLNAYVGIYIYQVALAIFFVGIKLTLLHEVKPVNKKNKFNFILLPNKVKKSNFIKNYLF